MATDTGADLGTQEAWRRHQRKMATDQQVSRIRKMLNAGTVWCKLRYHGRQVVAEVGSGKMMREGVRVA